jgi:molecular chaperone HscB
VCEACGELLEPRTAPSPFAIFGLEPAFELDPAVLQKRHLALARRLHPDFHGSADVETRRLAEDSSAALNQAHATLQDEARRADWLVRHLGGPREEDERGMPATFLQEVLEWNEAIAEARAAGSGTTLAGLRATLEAERARARAALRTELVPLASEAAHLRRARQLLNSLRYLERALREIGELALAHRTP